MMESGRNIHPFVLGLQGAPKATRVDPPQFTKWKHARGFVLQNFLSVAECNELITTARSVAQQAGKTGDGFEKLDKEYPPAYRSNSRILMQSSNYASALYRRLLPRLKLADIDGIRPYGFENSGVWKPVKLNDVIKISHYKSNNEFKAHFDGSVAEDDQTRSIFTLLIYLNEAFSGGETEFYYEDDKVKIKPKTGLAIIFNHDLRHAGLPVAWGGKYILKTEIMFRSFSSPDPSIQEDPLFKEVDALYDESAQLEKSGNAEGATELYIKALKLQTKNGSVPEEIVVSKNEDATAEIPLSIMVNFLQYIPFKELVALQTVSKRWNRITKNEFCWHLLFLSQFPSQCAAEGVIINSHKQDAFLLDWYQLFRTSFQAGRSKVVTLQTTSKAVHYKIAHSAPQNVKNVFSKAVFESHAHIHGHSPFRSLEDVNVYCDDVFPDEFYNHRWETPALEGKIKDWTSQTKIIKWIFRKKLRLNLETTPMIFAEENTATDEEHKLIIQNAFEVLNLPSICIVPSAVLALLASAKESGLVVEVEEDRATISPVINTVLQRKVVSVWNKKKSISLAATLHETLAGCKDDKSGVAKHIVFCGKEANETLLAEVTKELQFLFMDQPLPSISLASTSSEPRYAVVEGGDLVATLSHTTNRFKFMTRTDYYTTLNAARASGDTKRELEMVRKLRAAMLGKS